MPFQFCCASFGRHSRSISKVKLLWHLPPSRTIFIPWHGFLRCFKTKFCSYTCDIARNIPIIYVHSPSSIPLYDRAVNLLPLSQPYRRRISHVKCLCCFMQANSSDLFFFDVDLQREVDPHCARALQRTVVHKNLVNEGHIYIVQN